MNEALMAHRCAVCWEKQANHQDWYDHAIKLHGSLLDQFGYDRCRRSCPGIEHARRLPNFGQPRVLRARPEPQPFKARDGTLYTPQPLFGEP